MEFTAMQYTNIYQSPIGEILLVCDNKGHLPDSGIKGANTTLTVSAINI